MWSTLNWDFFFFFTLCICFFLIPQNLLSCLRPSPPANMSSTTSMGAQTAAVWSCRTKRASVQWAWRPPCPLIHPAMVTASSGARPPFLPPPPHPCRARRTSTWSWVPPRAPAAGRGTGVPRSRGPQGTGRSKRPTGWGTSGTATPAAPTGNPGAKARASQTPQSSRTPWRPTLRSPTWTASSWRSSKQSACMWRTCAASWRWVEPSPCWYQGHKCRVRSGFIRRSCVCSTFGMWLIGFNRPGLEILELDKCCWDSEMFPVFQTTYEAGIFCGFFILFSLLGSFFDFLLLARHRQMFVEAKAAEHFMI